MFVFALGLLMKRRITYFLLISVLWLTLGVTNFIVLTYRSSPLSAIDFLIIKSAITMIPLYLSVPQIILIAAALLLFIAALVYSFIKCPRCHVSYKKSLACIIAAGLTVTAFTTMTAAVGASHSEAGELTDSYESQGFVYCFAKSIVSQGVNRPSGYSSDKASEIVDSLKDTADTSTSGKLPNIIYVQLESFFDVKYLKDIEFSEDPIPNFTALKENGISGFFGVPHVGGGTANIEFEVLTGMNLDHFGFGEFPYTTVLQSQTCESMAYNLKSLGYGTHAIHNHTGTFYNRHKVYPNLGFDTFTPLEMMTDITRNPLGFVNDSILINEINSALDSTDTMDFVFAVSVQGHGKYPEEPLENQGIITEKGVIEVYNTKDDAEYYQYEFYVNQLYEMDRFIKDLCISLEERDEPCVVVFYGDHLPAIPVKDSDLINGNTYETEYAIWSNFKLEGIDAHADPNSYDRNIEAYMLSAYVQKLCAMHVGDITLLHQHGFETGENYDDILHTLEYASLYDADTSVYTPTEIVFGTREITVDYYYISKDSLYVKGSGFNEYSTVKIDGVKKNTTFIDSETISVENVQTLPKNAEVVQIADDGTEMS